MPLFIPKPQLDQVTEQGQEAEARKKKAFLVSILFILFLSLFVFGVLGILQIFRKDDDGSLDNGNSTNTSTTETSTS